MKQDAVDMVVDRDGLLLRVQVKTATWSKTGPYNYLQCRTRLTNKFQNAKPHELYDVLVAIIGESIWEIPASEVSSSNLSLAGTHPDYGGTRWDAYRVQ